MSDETPKSAFQEAIEARFADRKEHAFDVDGYFGLGLKPVPTVGIRALTKMDEIHAIDEAYKLAKKLCNEQEAREHPAVFEDIKLTCMVFRAARAVGTSSKYSYPAFGGPEWMLRNMTGDQIGAMTHLANTVKRRESPTPVDITDENVEALATALSASAGKSTADVILAGIVDRDDLNYFIVAISDKLMTARADLVAYVKEQEAKEAAAQADAPDPDDQAIALDPDPSDR